MASVEVESSAATIVAEKVETTEELAPKEVEAVVATPPAPEPEVVEPVNEPPTVDAPPPAEVEEPVKTETEVVDEPKPEVDEPKADVTLNEVKETEKVAEETPATTEAVAEETPVTVAEEAEKPVVEVEKTAEADTTTEVATEEKIVAASVSV